MDNTRYRIESVAPMTGGLLPEAFASGAREYFFNNRSLAVVFAAKSMTIPPGREIRVVHVPTGEVVFSKSADLNA